MITASLYLFNSSLIIYTEVEQKIIMPEQRKTMTVQKKMLTLMSATMLKEKNIVLKKKITIPEQRKTMTHLLAMMLV